SADSVRTAAYINGGVLRVGLQRLSHRIGAGLVGEARERLLETSGGGDRGSDVLEQRRAQRQVLHVHDIEGSPDVEVGGVASDIRDVQRGSSCELALNAKRPAGDLRQA